MQSKGNSFLSKNIVLCLCYDTVDIIMDYSKIVCLSHFLIVRKVFGWVSLPSHSWSVNSSNSDSVKQAASEGRARLIAYAEQRASRLLRLRASTRAESPP